MELAYKASREFEFNALPFGSENLTEARNRADRWSNLGARTYIDAKSREVAKELAGLGGAA